MLTELNLKSATQVKMYCILLYSCDTSYLLALPCLYVTLFCHVCCAKVTLTKLLEEPHQSVLNFRKGTLARRKLCTAVSRASGSTSKWCWLYYDEAQDAVFCFICVLFYIYVFMVTF